MKPIYISPELAQAESVERTLTNHGINVSLVRQQEAGNSLAPAGITWFELWVKDEAHLPQAKAIVNQHEFGVIKDNLKALNGAGNDFTQGKNGVQPAGQFIPQPEHPEQKEQAKQQIEQREKEAKIQTALKNLSQNASRQEILQMAQASGLPVNNQKVFHRLAQTLGFSEEEIAEGQHNNLRRPWNGDRLQDQVKALQQICKSKPVPQLGSNT
jgi:hypothetical protein